MRRLFAVLVFSCLGSAPVMAAPAGVFLLMQDNWNEAKLVDVIHAAFDKAGIKLLPAAAPTALIVTIPAGLNHSNRDANFQFTASFYWQGNKLADAVETCAIGKPQLCADQFVADIQSALAASN